MDVYAQAKMEVLLGLFKVNSHQSHTYKGTLELLWGDSIRTLMTLMLATLAFNKVRKAVYRLPNKE